MNRLLNRQTESFFHSFIRLATGTLDVLWLTSQKKKKTPSLVSMFVSTLNAFENVKSHCEVHTEIQWRYPHRQIFDILFCPQNLSTVLKFSWRNWCICEYTFTFKTKSTQKLTDLLEVKENFSKFRLVRKETAGDGRSAIWLLFLASSSILIWCAQQHLLTAWIRWETTACVCPTWFFLLLFKLWWLISLAYCQNSLCSWNIILFPGLNNIG